MENYPEREIALPSNISKVGEKTKDILLARFDDLVELRRTPLDTNGRAKNYTFDWPSTKLTARPIPGGVLSLGEEDDYDFDRKIDEFCELENLSKCYFWGIGAQKYGIFAGNYNEKIRVWIKSELIFTPTIIMFEEQDVIFLSHEQWHMSVIGASEKIIESLESIFGGATKLKNNFLEWVNEGAVGYGAEGRQWAYEYPVKWCEWDENSKKGSE